MPRAFALLLTALLIVTALSHGFNASARLRDIDTIDGVAAAMAAMGFRDIQTRYDIVTARYPSCEAPVSVLLTTLAGGDEARLRSIAGPDDWQRTIYLGTVTADNNMLANYRAWLFANARLTWQHRGYRAPGATVRAIISKSCPPLLDLDWARLSPADN